MASPATNAARRQPDDILIGGFGNDRLEGSFGDDALFGDEGNDSLHGDAGDDVIDSGTGNDTVFGGAGDDVSISKRAPPAKRKQVFAEQGDDRIIAGAAIDAIDGGQGIDLVDYSHSSAAVSVDLLAGKGVGGFAEGDSFWSVEDILGSAGDDVLAGNGAYNTIDGWLGNDTIRGGAGGDLLDGGEGVDWLSYSAPTPASSSIWAPARRSAVTRRATRSAISRICAGRNTVTGFPATPPAMCSRAIRVSTSCSAAAATICLSAAPAATGCGATRAPIASISTPSKTLTREARDVIRDFHHAEGDLIDLSDIDASTLLAGDQAFAFIATSAFTGVAGELRYETAGGSATIFGDVDGDSLSDFAVALDAVASLAASDFIV